MMRTPPGYVSMYLRHRALILLRQAYPSRDIQSTFREETEDFRVIVPRDLWLGMIQKRLSSETEDAMVYRLCRKEGDAV
jgi:hypothetical protein